MFTTDYDDILAHEAALEARFNLPVLNKEWNSFKPHLYVLV